jgi:hypothetical protein
MAEQWLVSIRSSLPFAEVDLPIETSDCDCGNAVEDGLIGAAISGVLWTWSGQIR